MATRKKTPPPDEIGDVPERIGTDFFYGLDLDDEQLAFANAIWSPDYDIIFCNSVAGTGKTTIATGVANLLCQYKRYGNIVYVMSP